MKLNLPNNKNPKDIAFLKNCGISHDKLYRHLKHQDGTN